MKTQRICLILIVCSTLGICSLTVGKSHLPIIEDTRVAIWKYLDNFDQPTRVNAIVHLQLPPNASQQHRLTADQIEEAWKAGEYKQALTQLRAFESTKVPVMLGIQWKQPMPMGFSADRLEAFAGKATTTEETPTATGEVESLGGEPDARIGGTRTGSTQIVLTSSYANDSIYAAVRWTALVTPAWSLNVSTNDGASWSEVYNWVAPSGQVIDLDIARAPIDDIGRTIWVAYIFTGIPDAVLANYFYEEDGTYLDYTAFFYDTPQAKTEVAIADCDTSWEPQPIITAIQDNGVLRCFHYSELPTGVTNVAQGLDLSASVVSEQYGLTQTFLYAASYIGTDNQVHIWHRFGYDPVHEGIDSFGVFSGNHPITTISVGMEWGWVVNWSARPIICLYEEAFTNGQGIRFLRSYYSGEGWASRVFIEPEAGEGDFSLPALPKNHGDYYRNYSVNNCPAVYMRNQNQQVYLRHYNRVDSIWSQPVPFDNDHSCYSGVPLSLEWVLKKDEEIYGLGLGYIHRYFADGAWKMAPYFDRAPGPGGYCHARSEGSSTWIDSGILSLTLGSIDVETSFSAWGYSDLTQFSTLMERTHAYLLTVQIASGSATSQCKAWADWNQDLDFDDSGEAIVVSGSPGPGPYTAAIVPPDVAALGKTRLRIRSTNNEVPLQCGYSSAGEVEDYTIEVINGYCQASSGCGQYISRVQMASIDQSSSCDGYTLYALPVPDLYAGREYPITFTIANGYAGNSGGLWIDWNQDMDFADSEEAITLTPAWGAGPYTATIVPPLFAAEGQTRMRVRLHREVDFPEPCYNESYGEVEDYTVNIVKSPTCEAQGACEVYIQRVEVGTIDNSFFGTGCTVGYSDYSNLSTEMWIGGEPIPITITPGNAVMGDQCSVWVDWNRDLDFEDAGEAIPLSGGGPFTGEIAPPPSAWTGDTILRVRLTLGVTPQACGKIPGEVEDYTITINACQRWDLSCNGCINLEDVAIFAMNWLQTPCSDPYWCDDRDIDMGGAVDAFDLSLIASHWLEGCN